MSTRSTASTRPHVGRWSVRIDHGEWVLVVPRSSVIASAFAIPLSLQNARCRPGALIATLGPQERLHAALIEEFASGVHVSDTGQLLRDVVEIQLEDREEALQIGLLIDGELDLTGGEKL